MHLIVEIHVDAKVVLRALLELCLSRFQGVIFALIVLEV